LPRNITTCHSVEELHVAAVALAEAETEEDVVAQALVVEVKSVN
jgi:hypothetical protein